MSRPRSIPIEDLALAYELRQEYGMTWKTIARMVGCNHNTLRSYVSQAINSGLTECRA